MRCRIPAIVAAFLVLATASAGNAQAPPANARFAAVLPFIDANTLAVGRLDLERIDLIAAGEGFGDLLPAEATGIRHLKEGGKFADLIRKQLVTSGVTEVFVVYATLEMKFEGAEETHQMQEFFVVLPTQKGKDPEKVLEIANNLGGPRGFIQQDCVIIVPPYAHESVKKIKAGDAKRFEAGFQTAGKTDFQLVLAPTPEVLASIPSSEDSWRSPFTARQLEVIKQSKAFVVTANLPKKSALGGFVLMNDEAGAAEALKAWNEFLSSGPLAEARKDPYVNAALGLFVPKVEGNKLKLIFAEADGSLGKLVTAAKAGVPVLKAAGELGQLEEFDVPQEVIAALGPTDPKVIPLKQIKQSGDNLKKLGLGIMNYHDFQNAFPPLYIVTGAGKPGLSWRVALLPYLDEQELFEQFHLDEPWDSEHNKKLIAKMPDVLKSPYKDAGEGKTIYLAAAGKDGMFVPPVLVDGKWLPKYSLAGAGDGPANTAAAVEVAEESAVIWTKPDEGYVWNADDPFHDLPTRHGDIFMVLRCDGSWDQLNRTVAADKWKSMLNRHDGK